MRILTGIRPTGNLHLGHYFGAVCNWVKLQDEYEMFVEIADVQALTDNFNNPNKVRDNVYELVLDLLACGIDPDKVNIFIQSQIPEIASLTVYFSNLVTISRLYRNPTIKTEIKQKKELFGNNSESVTYGFLGYPISQAADICIFDSNIIPVGEDQLPLIEQCREIIKKFNNIYGFTFSFPKELLSNNKRLKGLDGNDKMGKSLGNAIYLIDSKETISKKIMQATTDPNKIKKDDKANPDVCMVFYYHQLFTKDLDNVCSECKKGLRGCVSCKKELIDNIYEFLKPIQERRKYYEEQGTVDEILKKGTNIAKKEASKKMLEIENKMKIDYFKD